MQFQLELCTDAGIAVYSLSTNVAMKQRKCLQKKGESGASLTQNESSV